jgi:hypothetical protein
VPTRHDCAAPQFSAQVPVRNLVLAILPKWTTLVLNLVLNLAIIAQCNIINTKFSTVRLFINRVSFGWPIDAHGRKFLGPVFSTY